MKDIIEIAEAELDRYYQGWPPPTSSTVSLLVAELKIARAEKDRLQRQVRYLDLLIKEEVARLSEDECAELDRLREDHTGVK